jgi:hypothetical protein
LGGVRPRAGALPDSFCQPQVTSQLALDDLTSVFLGYMLVTILLESFQRLISQKGVDPLCDE